VLIGVDWVAVGVVIVGDSDEGSLALGEHLFLDRQLLAMEPLRAALFFLVDVNVVGVDMDCFLFREMASTRTIGTLGTTGGTFLDRRVRVFGILSNLEITGSDNGTNNPKHSSSL
jgi:hypothetical protein